MSSFITEKRFFASVALVVLACLGCSRQSDAAKKHAPPPSEEPDPEGAAEPETAETPEAPTNPRAENPDALEVIGADALKAKLRASGRKGTLVNAWASFCGPCKREIPMLESLANNLRPRGLDVVLVSVDEPADEAKARAFLRERGIRLQSYLAARPLGPFKEGLNPRWPGMLPASFLLDADGTLRYFWGGEAFENEVLPVLEAFVAGKPLKAEESTPLVAPENAE